MLRVLPLALILIACTPTTTSLMPGTSVSYGSETCTVVSAPSGGQVVLDCPNSGRVTAQIEARSSAATYEECRLEQELQRRLVGEIRGAALDAAGLSEIYRATQRAQRIAGYLDGHASPSSPDPCAHLQ